MELDRLAHPPPLGSDEEPGPPAFVEVEGLTRSFGETRALVTATVALAAGEIHALVGENGSGKSTMIKVLAGVLRPDAGEVRVHGTAARFAEPRASQRAGIATVFQETLVVPDLTVLDNVMLGTEGVFRHSRSRQAERTAARAALADLGLEELDLDRPLRSLSLANQQLVTIARAIARPWQLLILDESTSALDSTGRDRLFDYVRRSREAGRAILFTSHRMDEVQRLADVVSVMRQGTIVTTAPIADLPPSRLLELMAGSSVLGALSKTDEGVVVPERRRDVAAADLVLRVRELRVRRTPPAFALEVHAGEILGVAGLEGHGQSEFTDCLCGLRRPVTGTVEVADAAGAWHQVHGFHDANRRGIAHVPRDRKTAGLFPSLSIADNFGIALFPTLQRLGLIRESAVRREFREYAKLLRLVSGAPGDPVTTLSGGNQQKILLGRWLATRPRVLVLNDPLRGVDANTKEELYPLFRTLAGEGLTIVLLSSEILELLVLCDRIAVFYEGGLETVLDAAGTAEADVVRAMFGESRTQDADV